MNRAQQAHSGKRKQEALAGIRQRWDAGYAHTRAVLAREPWGGQFDPLSGVILHETKEYEALVR